MKDQAVCTHSKSGPGEILCRYHGQESELSLTRPLVLVLGPGSMVPRLVSRSCARPRVSSQYVMTRPPEGVRSVQA